jgi:hypothetical protein
VLAPIASVLRQWAYPETEERKVSAPRLKTIEDPQVHETGDATDKDGSAQGFAAWEEETRELQTDSSAEASFIPWKPQEQNEAKTSLQKNLLKGQLSSDAVANLIHVSAKVRTLIVTLRGAKIYHGSSKTLASKTTLNPLGNIIDRINEEDS